MVQKSPRNRESSTQPLIELLASMGYRALVEEPFNIINKDGSVSTISPLLPVRTRANSDEPGPYLTEEEYKLLSEHELLGTRKKAIVLLKQFIQDVFDEMQTSQREISATGLVRTEDGRYRIASEDSDQENNRLRVITLGKFREHVSELKKGSPERGKLATAVREKIIEQMIHMPDEWDEDGIELKMKCILDRLPGLAHTANDYFAYLKGKHLNKIPQASLKAGVQNCNDIGELFLRVFDKRFTPVVRREAMNKLIFIILLAELENYTQESKGAMQRLTDILEDRVFITTPTEGEGHTRNFYLYTKHENPGHRTLSFRITPEKERKEPSEKETVIAMRRFMGRPGVTNGPEREFYVGMDNRQKTLLSRMSKLIRESWSPGERENDLHGFRFTLETREDQQLFMNKMVQAILDEVFEKINSPRDSEDTPNNAWFLSLMEHHRKAKEISPDKNWLILNNLIPVSPLEIEKLKSDEAKKQLGMDITKCPVFITEFKDNWDGKNGFNGRSKKSSNSLKVIKFKLHIVNPKKPKRYDTIEVQFFPPDGIGDITYADTIRHSRFATEKAFDHLLPMIFPPTLYGIDLEKEKKKAFEREAKRVWPERGNREANNDTAE